ncbi:hypothetical protein ANN_04406 [Periplaneta americana]|uniref:Uncharacterized protein n=1 Tax=Periplaneta americana TaxID=6978 RepID=A0ABQ8T8G5_PERAM|nr:hypothetical protein ANN_04406 [Periplaneta americana]
MIANELRRTDKYEVYEEIGCLSSDGPTRRAGPLSFIGGLRDLRNKLCNELNVLILVIIKVISPSLNPQAGGPPLIGCPRLLIQYIHSYSPYLEAVSSIRNLRTRHAVVISKLY